MPKNLQHILFRKIFPIIWVASLCAYVAILSACSEQKYVYIRSEEVRVTVAESAVYTASFTTKKVKRGADVEIILHFTQGFVFDSCDYSGHTAVTESDNHTKLVLHNVRFPVFLNVSVKAISSGIYYDANGGYVADGVGGYLEWIPSDAHLRPNTSTGIYELARKGYTLKGWNTRPDGSGVHTGLGSRVTADKEGIIRLYAEWAKWNDADEFVYGESDGGIVLTGYLGEKTAESLVVPSEINGKKVTGIDKDFAPGLSVEELVLPAGLKRIEDGAFPFCDINHIYFYNDIERISDRVFSRGKLKTMHINAATLPRYLSSSEPSEFADKMDRLILNADKKKLIFFAGCSMSYGLNSEIVAEHYPDYTILNMGTMGGTNADLQLDCIIPFVGKDDIFIHAPEQASGFQLFYEKDCDKNFFLLCEGNPDLASYIDLSEVFGVFAAFNAYNGPRLLAEAENWTSDNDYHNEYGDVIIPRSELNTDEKHGEGEYTYELDYLTDESLSRMCDAYDALTDMGATVLFSYAPLNYNSLSEKSIFDKDWEKFASVVERKLSERGYETISDVTDYLMAGRYFYDTDYHLNEIGCEIRTSFLLDDLQNYFITG